MKNSVKILRKNWKIIIDTNLYKTLVYLLDKKYMKEFTVLTYADRGVNTFTLHTPFFPKQENTPMHTEFSSEDLIDLMINEQCDLSKLQGHVHSHVNMPVRPSSTDTKEIAERGLEGEYSASIIINKKLEVFGHIVDSSTGMYISDVDVQIGSDEELQKYDNSRLSRVKKCKNLQDVAQILKTSYSMSIKRSIDPKRVRKELDKQVLVKFKTPPIPIYKNKMGVQKYDPRFVEEWEEDEYDFYTQ